MARPVELHRCPSRLDRSATTGTRQQGWCDHDLPKWPLSLRPPTRSRPISCCTPGRPGQLNTPPPAGSRSPTGSGSKPSSSFLDAASDLGGSLLDLDSDPPGVAAKLPMAARVLAQPTLSAAADAAAGLLAIDGAHAPITPGWRILSHHYSPLLAAIQLHSVRDQLPPDQQLTGLQQHPPPIDYPSRRAAGDNLALLAAAVNAGRHRHPNRLRRGVLAASTRL